MRKLFADGSKRVVWVRIIGDWTSGNWSFSQTLPLGAGYVV
jgi:hypothetical protein